MRRMTQPDMPVAPRETPANTGGMLAFPSPPSLAPVEASQPPATPSHQSAPAAQPPEPAHAVEPNVRIWRALYATHAPALLKAAARDLPDDEAEDIVEGVFTAYWYKFLADAGRAPHPVPAALLHRMTRDAVIDARRRRRRIRARLAEYMAHVSDFIPRWMNPEAHVGGFAGAVERAYRDMPPRTQEVHRLRFEMDYSAREVADICGVSLATVKTLLQRGNRIMRDHLERAGYAPQMRRAMAAGRGGTR